MASPLVFHAANLHQRLFSTFLYPHLISFNCQTNTWTMEKDKRKTLAFNLVAVLLICFIGIGLCLFQILKYIINPVNAVTGMMCAVLVAGCSFGVLGWGIIVLFYIYGHDFCDYSNILLHLGDDKRRPHFSNFQYGQDSNWSWREKYNLIRSIIHF